MKSGGARGSLFIWSIEVHLKFLIALECLMSVFKEEVTLKVGKERLCGEVEMSARCSNAPMNSPVKQHALLLAIPVSSRHLSLLGLCE